MDTMEVHDGVRVQYIPYINDHILLRSLSDWKLLWSWSCVVPPQVPDHVSMRDFLFSFVGGVFSTRGSAMFGLKLLLIAL